MKAIVYYSLTGNTDYVAKLIKEKINADLIRLYPEKEYPSHGFKKFFWGGKSAVMKEVPKLEKYDFDINKYDEIIIGTPIWAGTFTPPIRSFILENKDGLKNKKISVFLCYSGGGDIKTFERLKELLEIRELNNFISIIDPLDKKNDQTRDQINLFIDKIKKR